MHSGLLLRSALRGTVFLPRCLMKFRFIYRCRSSEASKRNISELFLKPEVQKILYRITGLNFDKVFAPKKHELVPYEYEFVTDKQLQKLQEEAKIKAEQKLQMPPVMEVREPINQVLSKDPELQGYLRNKLLFIDTSVSSTSRDRIITVRELDGTLRKATWEERSRMNQAFFPLMGRNIETPKMFEDPYFKKLLAEESYKFILDAACLQFEPDDPEYHRVTTETYEHINQEKKFDGLRSTRHFGPMAFYFALKKSIDGLVIDMIERHLLQDAVQTIRLLMILNPDVKLSTQAENDLDIIKDYIQHGSTKRDDLEKVLQTFVEQQSHTNVVDDFPDKISI